MSTVKVSQDFVDAVDALLSALEQDFGESDDPSESLDGNQMKTTFGHIQRVLETGRPL